MSDETAPLPVSVPEEVKARLYSELKMALRDLGATSGVLDLLASAVINRRMEVAADIADHVGGCSSQLGIAMQSVDPWNGHATGDWWVELVMKAAEESLMRLGAQDLVVHTRGEVSIIARWSDLHPSETTLAVDEENGRRRKRISEIGILLGGMDIDDSRRPLLEELLSANSDLIARSTSAHLSRTLQGMAQNELHAVHVSNSDLNEQVKRLNRRLERLVRKYETREPETIPAPSAAEPTVNPWDLPLKHPQHDCAECGNRHNSCKHCLASNGDTHDPNCVWVKGPKPDPIPLVELKSKISSTTVKCVTTEAPSSGWVVEEGGKTSVTGEELQKINDAMPPPAEPSEDE